MKLTEMKLAGDFRKNTGGNFAVWSGWRSYDSDPEEAGKFILTPPRYRPNGNGPNPILKKIGMGYIPSENRILVSRTDSTLKFNHQKLSHSFTRRADWRDSKTATAIPRSNVSFSHSDNDLKKLLKELVKLFPEISEFTVDQLDPYQGLKVSEVISIPSSGDLMSRGKTMTLYHGTSVKRWEYIKKKGLVPGQGREYGDKIEGWSDENVYLTSSPHIARNYANRAAEWDKVREAAVLEVTVRDTTLLVADEDSFWWVNGSVNPKYLARAANVLTDIHKDHLKHAREGDEEDRKLADTAWKLFMTNAVRSLNRKGVIAYRGKIPARDVKLVEVYELEKMPKDPPSYKERKPWEKAYYDAMKKTEKSMKSKFTGTGFAESAKSLSDWRRA